MLQLIDGIESALPKGLAENPEHLIPDSGIHNRSTYNQYQYLSYPHPDTENPLPGSLLKRTGVWVK